MKVSMSSLLVAGLVAFAGCSGGGEDVHEGYECPDGTTLHEDDFSDHHEEGFNIADHCPGASSTTAPAVNVPPTIALKITDAAGVETNFTNNGGTLFFDATGTADSDGTLGAVAIIVDDGNRSVTKQLLVDGQFQVVNFTFDDKRYGPASVTVTAADNRNGISRMETMVYVNWDVTISPPDNPYLDGTAADQGYSASDCEGASGQAATDTLFSSRINLFTLNSTTFITATASNREVEIAVCDLDNNLVSNEGETVRTTAGHDFVAPSNGKFYSIFIVVTGPFIPNMDGTVPKPIIHYTVHYEPDTGA